MPNRIIREGFLDSERVDALTADAERLYHRLLLVCDDAGRLDGRPAMIAARCFPLRRDVRASNVARWVESCSRHCLLTPYEFDGKPFIQVTRWQRCGKSLTSKFPWKDGSFHIRYVALQTRDGVREFVTTSVPHADGVGTPCVPHADGVGTPCVPHADGVAGKTNTETETETETETDIPPPQAGAREGEVETRPEQRAMNWLLLNSPRLARNRGQVARFAELIQRVGYEKACAMASDTLGRDPGMQYPFTAIHQSLDDETKKRRGSNGRSDADRRRAEKRAGEYAENIAVPILKMGTVSGPR